MLERWAFFDKCGECDEPTDTFDVCSYLGFNLGTSGHLHKTYEDAQELWEHFLKRVEETPSEKRNSDYWIEYPFESMEEELKYLRERVSITQVIFPSWGETKKLGMESEE
jgi:hypothetical protein